MTNRASSLLLSLSLSVSSITWGGDATPLSSYASTGSGSHDNHQMSTQIAQRQNDLRDAMIKVQEARRAYSAGRYTQAEESYRAALDLLPQAEATKSQRAFIRKSLGDSLVAKAMDYREVGRTEEAIAFLKEACELDPTNKRARLELSHTQDPIRHSPALTPEHVGDVHEVNRLLTLAYSYYDLAKYDEALKTFRQVTAIDPYNAAAKRGMITVHERRSGYHRTEQDATRTRLLAEVDSHWNTDSRVHDEGAPEAEVIMPSADLNMGSDSQILFADALKQITLPQINLDRATIADFIDVLNGQIRVAATRGILTGSPFNIIENFGTTDSPAYKRLAAKRLTLNLSNVTLETVLQLATQQLGIQYEFVPAGIELTYSGADFGPIRTRQYTVHPSFFRDKGGADSNDEDGDFGSSDSGVRLRRLSAKAQLERMGVPFPTGADANYSAVTRTLTVRNTSHNLREIDELLAIPFLTDRQVMLNVYSMDVSQQDLEDLGFEWLINASISDAVYTAGGMVAPGAADAVSNNTVNINGQGNLVTSGLRSGKGVLTNANMEDLISAGSVEGYGAARAEKSPAVFGFRGIWSGADLTILMRGLNQKKGVDSLHNPQVIFSPGDERQVLVANVREFFVPSEYSEPELQQSSGSSTDPTYQIQLLVQQGLTQEEAEEAVLGGVGSGTLSTPLASPAHPTAFEFIGTSEEQFNGIGTTLAVHRAQILNNGASIVLDLSAAINEFDGFVNWGTPIRSGLLLEDGTRSDIVVTENRIVQPIFDRKFVNTSLELAPGNVVVFAALHDAKIIKYEDKVPIFGDIPLVGRLFRSEGTSRDKRVLLFFARVDIMDPTGLDVKTGQRPALSSQ